MIFAAGTLLSRASGLIRDMVVVGVFGASWLLDAFIVANRIPNLFREMLAEGALGSAFTKVYSAVSTEDEAKAQKLLKDALVLATILCLLLCALGILAAPQIVQLFTIMVERSDRPAEFFGTTVALTQLMFPFLLFAVLAAITMGVLHQSGRFLVTATAPIALNLGYIVGAVVFAKYFREHSDAWVVTFVGEPAISGLALGVLLGGFLYFAIQFVAVWRSVRLVGRFSLPGFPLSPEVHNVVSIAIPAAIAASAASINVLINTNFATSLDSGAVTWLNYSFRLLQLPVGLFGVAIGMAALPALARAIARAGNKVDEGVSHELQNAIELVTWCMVPCLMFLLMNSLPLIDVLFTRGRFSASDAQATAACLSVYGFGVIAYGLIKVFTAFYYSVERTSYAMRASLTAVGINLAANYYLVETFEHIGLAASTATSLSCNALLLAWGLRSEGVAWKGNKLLLSLGLLGAGAACTWLLQRFCMQALSGLDLGPEMKLESLMILGTNGILVVLVFLGLGWLRLGESPLHALRKR